MSSEMGKNGAGTVCGCKRACCLPGFMHYDFMVEEFSSPLALKRSKRAHATPPGPISPSNRKRRPLRQRFL
jgi:hypothetical protein